MRVEMRRGVFESVTLGSILGDDVNATTELAALIGTAARCDNADSKRARTSESGNATPARALGPDAPTCANACA